MATQYEQHVKRWWNCQACDLCLGRRRMVFGRGSLPADVVFIGEAPGASEDVIGRPFVGPAGHILDDIIFRSLPVQFKFAITNLVCCLPKHDGKKAVPLPEEVEACSDRLKEFVAIAQPRLIVCVGVVSRDYLDPKMHRSVRFDPPIPSIDITHPAHILRSNIAMQGLAIQRCVVTVSQAVRKYLMS